MACDPCLARSQSEGVLPEGEYCEQSDPDFEGAGANFNKNNKSKNKQNKIIKTHSRINNLNKKVKVLELPHAIMRWLMKYESMVRRLDLRQRARDGLSQVGLVFKFVHPDSSPVMQALGKASDLLLDDAAAAQGYWLIFSRTLRSHNAAAFENCGRVCSLLWHGCLSARKV